MTIDELLDKAKRWHAEGMLSESEYGAVCALVFVESVRQCTPEEAAEVEAKIAARNRKRAAAATGRVTEG